MKFCFENAALLEKAIAVLSEDLGITLSAREDADVTVSVSETADAGLTVKLYGGKASIVYGGGKARFFRALAVLALWVKDGKTEGELSETPLFQTNGAMVDMSRNAVMNVKTVKFMLRRMALMGLNTFMLYTEDTYEIKGYPYFGHMRGRYTKDEIRELDAYAIDLGIELVPCIQTLGHLATALRWSATAPYKDTSDVLLVGADATYRLIDAMLKTIAECFTSRRLHIGMDETHSLGTGASLDRFGYRERQELYFEHLAKVSEMAQSYGFRPMMWSDMFFRMSGKNLTGYKDYDVRVELPEGIGDYVPKGVQQVFWDYYNPDENFYAVNIDKHKLLDSDTIFAGGIWLWSGHCPHFSRSRRHTVPALEACRKKGIREIFATIWHNGSEAPLLLGLVGLAWYADYDYKGCFSEESAAECFRASCNASYWDLLRTELPEYPHGGIVGASRALVYNDPLIGLVDKHVEGLDTEAYYKDVTKQLTGLDSGAFASAADMIRDFSALLERKANFGVRLKAAYDGKDTEALSALAAECDEVIARVSALRLSHRRVWMEHYKPFGWEVHDIRYGGLIARFETTKMRIEAYLAGEIPAIEELAEERLRLDCADVEDPITGRFLWYRYQVLSTPSIL